MALDLAGTFNDFPVPGCIPYPPAGHAVCLGDTVNHDGLLFQFRTDRRNTGEFEIIINQFLINLIGNNPDVLADYHLGQRFQL